jgi:phosphate transport system permease protein
MLGFVAPEKTKAKKKNEVRTSDFVFLLFLKTLACLVIALILGILVFLAWDSRDILRLQGVKFLYHSDWNPVEDIYGAMPFIYGTLVTSLVALLISVPVSVGCALFITELSPRWMRTPVSFLIEMLAAIPSVVYGLWGIFVLIPLVRAFVQPFLNKYFGFIPLFQGPQFGIGILSASIILSIMILPTITSMTREVFTSIPQLTREAALTLGASRWEMIQMSVLKTALPGIFGAVVLGLGRAMGETMAVTMVIGNRADITWSLFAPGATMASVIANEYPEASTKVYLSALTAIGMSLFLVSLVVNLIARLIVYRFEKKMGRG